MLKIRITDFAKSDIEDIVEYTLLHWGKKQQLSVKRLIASSFRFIATHPKSGHKVKVDKTYTKVVARLPFVIVYELHREDIVITQILHSSRNRKL